MTITVLPEAQAPFVKAVAAGGVEAQPLSAETEGVVWLDPKGASQLAEVLDANPQVRWVQLPFAGVDAFTDVFTRHSSITFTSAKGAYDEPVAEHALALTLAALRDFGPYSRRTSWSEQAGRSLYDLRVAVVGAGGIGREIVRLLQPFRAKITVVRRRQQPVEGAERVVDDQTFHSLVAEFDVIILAAALTAGTKHLLGAEEFKALPNDAVVVNIARGPQIDTDALAEAIAQGEIAGAGVDVTDPEPLPDGHPLWTAGNVIITPHTANTWAMAQKPLSARISHNVRAFLGESDGGSAVEFAGVVDKQAGY
ncbi:MAG: NAD(P)-dependent oxidoreductase [Pseudoclavibacter sp.]